MAKKLKTYVTSVGFFDLAVAAPSMKAALDAWGFKHNAFQQGFASQTADPRIIAAATASPGVVLRRAVGTGEPFKEGAGLPKGFAIPKIGKAETSRAAPPARKHRKSVTGKADKAPPRAAIISFEKEKAKRDRLRSREDAQAKRENEKRRHAVEKAEKALERALARYERDLDGLERERAKLESRIAQEKENWKARRGELESSLDRARKQ